jgi:hypothetical protein
MLPFLFLTDHGRLFPYLLAAFYRQNDKFVKSKSKNECQKFGLFQNQRIVSFRVSHYNEKKAGSG